MTVRHIFEISEDDHPPLVTHVRDRWWTSDSANAFVFPGINIRAELVPSHDAPRRWLGDYKSNAEGCLKSNPVKWYKSIYKLAAVTEDQPYILCPRLTMPT
jgi:hypothetical protein